MELSTYAVAVCLTVPGLLIVSGNPDSCSISSLMETGYRLKNVSYNFEVKSSIFSCAATCVMTSICVSFDFDQRRKMCFLNFKDSSNAAHKPESGFLHSDITNWSKNISGLCSEESCSSTDMCTTYRNGQAECQPLLIRDVENDIRTTYAFFRLRKAWDDARVYCQEQGGHLAIIKNAIQNNFLEEVSLAFGNSANLFIGGLYNKTEGRYKWLDGSPVVYTSWAPDEPDEKEGRCLTMLHPSLWKDKLCTSERFFICQFYLFT
ncbi:collectin-10-like [Haliotis asinina]|uniref:collectin-10-like n=1 Tax=Haliotis asinina TaxID=109174 RepID=UPI00353267B1